MHTDLTTLISQHIRAEKLPVTFSETIDHYYLPVAQQIANWQDRAQHPIVIGLNGAQGSGKSTMAGFLQLLLQHGHNLRTAVMSIDDLYLTKAERQRLARDVHPLFTTRGVPGTHDIDLGINTINRLVGADPNEETAIPCFDKAVDERLDHSQWKTVIGQMEVVILEGWCVGAIPQPEEMLSAPVNALELSEDPEGIWRTYVNQSLGQSYQELFNKLDYLIMLKVPGFSCVREFRLKQEEKLRQKVAENSAKATALMTADEVLRFIMHYERLTEWMLQEMPGYADILLEVTAEHQLAAIKQ